MDNAVALHTSLLRHTRLGQREWWEVSEVALRKKWGKATQQEHEQLEVKASTTPTPFPSPISLFFSLSAHRQPSTRTNWQPPILQSAAKPPSQASHKATTIALHFALRLGHRPPSSCESCPTISPLMMRKSRGLTGTHSSIGLRTRHLSPWAALRLANLGE